MLTTKLVNQGYPVWRKALKVASSKLNPKPKIASSKLNPKLNWWIRATPSRRKHLEKPPLFWHKFSKVLYVVTFIW
jgi:hypothetical protein